MKRILVQLIAFMLSAALCPSPAAYAEGTEQTAGGSAVPKVIFDTDMAYVNDDAIAMFILAQADRAGMLKLLGVTTAGGNVFVPEATTAALRQLELIGRSDIPVYQGTDEPLQGFRDMKEESRLYGIPYYCGAYWNFGTNNFTDLSARSPDYLHLNEAPMHGYAETPAQEEAAWDYIIRTVHEYPGEVTIMTVGAATNVALALQKDPTIADDAAGIIYMGGDIDCPGDATPAAEMNWYYDPEAIRQCLAANWKSQLVVPDDLAQQIHLTPVIYERLAAANQNPVTKLILENQRTFDAEGADFVWDVVVPAVFLKPGLMVRTEERYITVDPTPGINSGRAVSWPQHWLNNMETGEGFPEGVNKAVIVFSIDEEAFWDFYVEMLSMEDKAESTENSQSLSLTGVGNARELGGYAAEDGKTVKRGVLLRTAKLSKATEEDIERLRAVYHLAVDVDFRGDRETESAPDPEMEDVEYLNIHILDDSAGPSDEMKAEIAALEEQGVEIDRITQLRLFRKYGGFSDQMYVDILSSDTGKAGYSRFFRALLALPEGRAILFHCSQGKDRTGCGAMLILFALGADEETVMQDFLLTNEYNAALIAEERAFLIENGIGEDELDEYMKSMDQVFPEFMANAIQWMTETYGSPLGYITQALGVTEPEIQALRDKFLE